MRTVAIVFIVAVYLTVAVKVGIQTLDGSSVLSIYLLVEPEGVRCVTGLVDHNGCGFSVAYVSVGNIAGSVEREVGNLVVQPCGVECGVPAEVLGVDDVCVERDFNTLGIYVAHVGEHFLGEVDARRNGHCCQKVFGLAGIVVDRCG